MLPTKPLNTDYLHNYSRELALQLSNKFFANVDVITGEQILEFSTIKQINFLIIKILEERWEAEALRLESPFFDYSQPEVQDGLRTFLNILSRHIKVQKKAFVSVLIEAVYGTLQLVLDPRSFYEQEIQKPANLKLTAEHYRRRIKYLQYNREIFKTFVGEVALRYPDTFQVSDAMVVWHNTLRDHWRYIEPIEWRVKAFSNHLELDIDAVYTRATEVEIQDTNVEVQDATITKVAEDVLVEVAEIEPQKEPNPAFAEEVTEIVQHIDLPAIEDNTTGDAEANTTLPALEADYEKVTIDLTDFVEDADAEEVQDIEPQQEETVEKSEFTAFVEDITPKIELEEKDFFAFETPEITPEISQNAPVVELEPVYNSEPTLPAHEKQTQTNQTHPIAEDSISAKYNQTRVGSLLDAIPLHEKFTFIDELFGGDNLAFQDALEKIDGSPNYEDARRLTNQYVLQHNWDFDRESTQNFLAWLGRRF